MPIEIEAKLRVEDHEAVRASLRRVGAVCAGRVLETNRIFDNAERSLLAGDRGLRVRSCADEAGRLTAAVLTYKGPRQGGQLKTREEIQTQVADPLAAAAILHALGYVEAICFEKRRESWRLGGCTVELDELPHLGRFVEIEGPDEAAVQAVQRQLGLEGDPHIPRSYVAMLAEHCREHQLPTVPITFANS